MIKQSPLSLSNIRLQARVITDITQESAEIAECAANSRQRAARLIAVTVTSREHPHEPRDAGGACGASGACVRGRAQCRTHYEVV